MTKFTEEVHVNKIIQGIVDQICDLFCIDDEYKPILNLRPYKNNQCGYFDPSDNTITVGCKGGLRLTTLVHEYLHAAGYDHQDECSIDTRFRSNCELDSFSKLIVKDLTWPNSVKELIL